MASSDVVVRFLGDTIHLDRAFRHLDGKSKSWSKSFAKVGIAAGVVGVGIGVAAGAMWDMVKAAAEDEQAAARLAKVMKNTQKATAGQVRTMEDWIFKTQMAVGVSDEELRPALIGLMVAGRSASQAQSDMGVAMDIAAAKGYSLDTVIKSMSKAAQGSVGAMGRLGLKFKDTEGKALSYEQVLKLASQSMGGSSVAAADTLNGKLGRLGMAWSELKEGVGAALAGPLEGFTTWLLVKGIPRIKEMWAVALPKLKSAWATITAKIKEYQPTWEKIGKAISDFGNWLIDKGIPGFIEFSEVKLGNIIGEIEELVDFIEDLVGALDSLGKKWQSFDKWVKRTTGYKEPPKTEADLYGSSGSGSRRGGYGSVPVRAAGGPVSAGRPYWVGERGPELFSPGRSGTIIPNGAAGGQDIVIMLDSRVIARAQNINARAGVRVRVA
jgi:phage-related minor tail protein